MFVYVPPPPAPPSREALQLSEKLSAVVRAEIEADPALGPHDIQMALKIAAKNLSGDGEVSVRKTLLLVVAALGFMLSLGLLVFLAKTGVVDQQIFIFALVAGLALLVLLVFKLNSSSRSSSETFDDQE